MYDYNFSNWVIYDAKQDFQTLKLKQWGGGDPSRYDFDNLDARLRGRLRELHHWADRIFFRSHSFKRINWMTTPSQTRKLTCRKSNQKLIENLDMILRVAQRKDGGVLLHDWEGKKYVLEKDSNRFKRGVCFFFSKISINKLKSKRKILLKSNHLVFRIPDYFFDAKMFDKQFFDNNQEALTRKINYFVNPFGNRISILNKFQFLKDYDFEQHLIGKKDLIVKKYPDVQSRIATLIHKNYAQKWTRNFDFIHKLSKKQRVQLKNQRIFLTVQLVDYSVDLGEVSKICGVCQKRVRSKKCCKKEPGHFFYFRLTV